MSHVLTTVLNNLCEKLDAYELRKYTLCGLKIRSLIHTTISAYAKGLENGRSGPQDFKFGAVLKRRPQSGGLPSADR